MVMLIENLKACEVGNPFLLIRKYLGYPLSGTLNETIKGTNPLAEANKEIPRLTSETEVKPSKIVHRLSSPPTRESSPKKHKGKQKESSRKKLKEFLSNLEDEMICPMSGSVIHLDNKPVLTFTISDVVTSCK
jgi:hypothetical protein